MTEDEKDTVPICIECMQVALKGGDIPPTIKFISQIGQCSFGDGWSWCKTKRRYSRWLPADG